MSTTTVQMPDPAPSTRLRWAASDSWTMTRRTLAHWVRAPAPVVFNLLFPVLMLVMFGYLLGGQMQVPAGTSYFTFLVPGMLTLTVLFGIETTVLAVTTDASRGVTDRFRSMPMSGSAVVIGRSLADMLNSIVALAVVLGAGFAVGWRPRDATVGVLAGLGMLLVLRFALVWLGIYLGLLIKAPEGVVALQVLVWPLAFLSNIFTAPSSMPAWLTAVAEWNPLSATTAAVRELFGNPGWTSSSWISDHAILMGLLWPAVLTAIFLPLSVRSYRRLDR